MTFTYSQLFTDKYRIKGQNEQETDKYQWGKNQREGKDLILAETIVALIAELTNLSWGKYGLDFKPSLSLNVLPILV